MTFQENVKRELTTYRPIIGGAKCTVAHPTKMLDGWAHPAHAAGCSPHAMNQAVAP